MGKIRFTQERAGNILTTERTAIVVVGNPTRPGGSVVTGGFGTEAQLCLISNLYLSLRMSNILRTYYANNRNDGTYKKEPCLIYSPNCYIIKEDSSRLIKLKSGRTVNIITMSEAKDTNEDFVKNQIKFAIEIAYLKSNLTLIIGQTGLVHNILEPEQAVDVLYNAIIETNAMYKFNNIIINDILTGKQSDKMEKFFSYAREKFKDFNIVNKVKTEEVIKQNVDLELVGVNDDTCKYPAKKKKNK